MDNIAICLTHPDLMSDAILLQNKLHCPIVTGDAENYAYLLMLTPDFVGLKKNAARANPLIIDFNEKTIQYRARQANLKNEALARAFGLKKSDDPFILDSTGGLGLDSFILASLGFTNICLTERSPIVAALLKDGLKRAHLEEKIQLFEMDAMAWLQIHPAPDYIYLDPMFPAKQKTALAKQAMQLFHAIVGQDADADRLLMSALACAKKRVVVKRPRAAKPIDTPTLPSFSLEGRSCRFDVYVI